MLGRQRQRQHFVRCVDCAYKYDQRDGITSENNDGYSVSFDVSRSVDSMLYRIAEVYLVNTGLMDLVVDDDYE